MIRTRSSWLAALGFAALLAAPDADARSARVNQVPNGDDFNCLLCHTSAGGGGGTRNDFSNQLLNSNGRCC